MRKNAIMLLGMLLALGLSGCGDKGAEIIGSTNETEENTNVATEENNLDIVENGAVEEGNADVLAACAGTSITQTIDISDGRKISIDAEVNVDGISRISYYRYVSQPITDEVRKNLFKEMHPADTWDVNSAAVYDAEKDTWEFVTPRGENWIYQVRDSQIPGEQILYHERIDVSLDYSEDNLIRPVLSQGYLEDELLLLMEVADCKPEEIVQIGQMAINSVIETGTYSCSNIYIYGNNGRQPYARAVFKQIVDGMPVTVWHNFNTATTDKSFMPIRVWGSPYSVEEIGLDKPILSVQEAVKAMQEQIDSIQIQKEVPISVTKISLEYLAVISSDGEPYIVPIWRFLLGNDEMERSLMGEKILAVNAVSGELIWEDREDTFYIEGI